MRDEKNLDIRQGGMRGYYSKKNSLGRRNIRMELWMRGSRSSLFEKRKNLACLDDRSMSLGIRQAARDSKLGQTRRAWTRILMRNGQPTRGVAWLAAQAVIRCFQVAEYNSSARFGRS